MLYSLVMVAALIISGCTSTYSYQRAYRRAWKKIVNSQAWKDALISTYREGADNSGAIYPLPGNSEKIFNPSAPGALSDDTFLDTYRSLVFRAYFRTIAEAERADSRIYEDFRRLNDQKNLKEKRNDPSFNLALDLARKRYQSHRKMLDGLKSWKAFNEFGSDDLDFFLREQLPHAHVMYLQGKTEDEILSYLVYRLADLYHFEE